MDDLPMSFSVDSVDAEEMTAAGMELDRRGRWTITADKARIAEWVVAA